MHAIDANVALEYLLDQDRADECEELMKRAFAGKIRVMMSGFNASSVLLLLLREHKPGLARRFLESFAIKDSVWTYPPMLVDQLRCMDLMDKYNLDFDDAITLQCALATGCDTLITLDSDFNNVKDIKVMSPKEYLAAQTSQSKEVREVWDKVLNWKSKRARPKDARENAAEFSKSFKMREVR